MKQNIFGVVLFSLIVGLAIFISEFFAAPLSLPAVVEKPFVVESKSNCGRVVYKTPAKGFGTVKLTQAVLNPKTNQLFTSLVIERPNSSSDFIGLTYHFYTKNGAENHYLASETVAIRPDFDANQKAVHELTSSYSWLDNLVTKNNIYVIATTENDGLSKSHSIPRFDEINATPVLLMKGKN